MLDVKMIRENTSEVRQQLGKRNFDMSLLDDFWLPISSGRLPKLRLSNCEPN